MKVQNSGAIVPLFSIVFLFSCRIYRNLQSYKKSALV
jgi:hypothetical protein